MRIFRELRIRARYVAGPVLGALVMIYFGYHVIRGDRGLVAWWQLTERVSTMDRTLASLRAERQILANRVRLLHPQTLDSDMLEERARVILNYGHADDIVVIDDQEK